ncbi:MAG: hypothetical protein KGJ41_11535 [Rhodospirillales bacterium]|nr:hypothetical protein [Rhodospirillales bacterium]MDE2199642.1 hypothetical protein [Rhodospirillales bacterium]MDE2574485.1 hypothetical protein [Rhodospirillales bacterium]
MQERGRIDRRAASGQTTSVPAARAELLAMLDEARDLAFLGDLQAARVFCAEAMFRHQPLLAGDPMLLAQLNAALIHARGFQLLGRLIAAIDGRTMRIVLAAEGDAGAPTTRVDADGIVHVTVTEAMLAQEAAVARWSEELAGLIWPASSRSAA